MSFWSRSSKYQRCVQTSSLNSSVMNDVPIMSNSYLSFIKMSLGKLKRRIYVTSASDNNLKQRSEIKKWCLFFASHALVTAGIFKTGDALSLKCLAMPSLHHEICILSSNIYSLSLSNHCIVKNFCSNKSHDKSNDAFWKWQERFLLSWASFPISGK